MGEVDRPQAGTERSDMDACRAAVLGRGVKPDDRVQSNIERARKDVTLGRRQPGNKTSRERGD